jgi:L-lactate dehydrogenase complex protein LldG
MVEQQGGEVNIPKSSRNEMLSRIQAATASAALDHSNLADGYKNLPRRYVKEGELPVRVKLDLFIERLREYDSEVIECSPDGLIAAIRESLVQSGRRIFAAPTGLPAKWKIPDVEWRVDYGLSYAEIEGTEGVVTGAFCAVADSGTIILHHSPAEGRRVLTLLPDWHLCVLYASQIVETFPEYFARVKNPPKLVTLISGPSATADIEMTRIKGVHGPRYLRVILVQDRVDHP